MNTPTPPQTHTVAAKTRKGPGLAAGILALAVLALPSAPLHATVLLNDTFADGSRTDQNLPTSSAWFTSSSSSTLSAATNQLVLTTGTSSRQAITYFTASGSPYTLATGESLSASFTLSPSDYSSSAELRIGLYNSDASRISADNLGNSNATYSDYTGYAAFTNMTSGAANGTTLRRRATTNTSLFGTTPNIALSGNTSALSLTNTATYTFTLTVTATTASSTDINILVKDSLNATVLDFSSTDTTTNFRSFDTFAIYATGGNSSTSAITLDNVLVQAVPEPGTLSLGACAFGILLLSRRGQRLVVRRSAA